MELLYLAEPSLLRLAEQLFSLVDHLVNLHQGSFRKIHTQINFHIKIVNHKNFLELDEFVTFNAELEFFILNLMYCFLCSI